MFCSYCGGELNQEARFCTYCGKELSSEPKAPMQEGAFSPQTAARPIQQPAVAIPKPAHPKEPKGRYLLFGTCGTAFGAILLAIILFATGIISLGGKTIEGPGFATPEDAAKAYLTNLRAQDMDAMLATIAVESYVDHYNLKAFVEHVRIYQPFLEIPLPNTNEYTRQLNVASRSNQLADQITIQYMYYNTPDAFNDRSSTMFADLETIPVFVDQLEQDTEDYVFDDLKITDILQPENLSDLYLYETNQQNIAEHAEIFGANADDIANVAVTFEADGQTWIFCPQAVRYNGRWYLESLYGNLSALLRICPNAYGIAPYEEN